MNVPTLTQHDPRWRNQQLGTMGGATIGAFGCAITCSTMMQIGFRPGEQRLVNHIDDLFTTQGGYVDGRGHRSPQNGCDLIDWNRIQTLLPDCGHVADADYPEGVPADVDRLIRHLDAGGLAILQVYWHGNKNLMHFVLAVGHNGHDIIVNDPEKGDRVAFSSKRFGSGVSSEDIYGAHLFSDTTPEVAPPPVPPQQPAQSPSAQEPGRGSGPVPAPAPAPEPPKEEEVTQATHDAAMAEQKKQYEAVIQELQEKLAGSVPEYVHTWSDPDHEVFDVLSNQRVVLVDFSDEQPPLEFGPNTLFTVQGKPFTAGGKEYYRTQRSVDGGYYYGVPVKAVTPHNGGVLGQAAQAKALTTSQNLHAAVADSGGFLKRLTNFKLFGGRS